MRSEQKRWLSIAMASTAVLVLAGCSEPNSPQISNASSAPVAGSSSAHADAETLMMSAYTPGQKIVPLTSCNLERFDDVTFSATERSVGQAHSISGWIAAPRLDKPTYWLRFDDKQANRYFQMRLNPSIERPDVVAIAGNEAFSPHSGFKVGISAGALAAGQYHAYLAAVAGDTAYTCDNGRQVSLRN